MEPCRQPSVLFQTVNYYGCSTRQLHTCARGLFIGYQAELYDQPPVTYKRAVFQAREGSFAQDGKRWSMQLTLLVILISTRK